MKSKTHRFRFSMSRDSESVRSERRLSAWMIEMNHSSEEKIEIITINTHEGQSARWLFTRPGQLCAAFRTHPSFLYMLTSSMPGILFMPSFFSDSCNFLSSVPVLWWMTFFLRRGMPGRFVLLYGRISTHKKIANCFCEFHAHLTLAADANFGCLCLEFLQFLGIHCVRWEILGIRWKKTNKLD